MQYKKHCNKCRLSLNRAFKYIENRYISILYYGQKKKPGQTI